MKRLAFLIALCFPSILSAQKLTSATKSLLIRKIDSVVANQGIPGLAIAVSQNEKIIWKQGFGMADLEQHVSVNPETTKFRIASISKALTSVGLGLLIQEGKLIADSSIKFYLKDFPDKKYKPTVRQVAGHIGGVRHYQGNENESAVRYQSVKHGLSIFENDSLLFKPGDKYHYSSYGFNLISAVMEQVSGEPFLNYMEEKVIRPLGMNQTVPDYTNQLIFNRGRYYLKGGMNAPYVDNSYKWAGGGYLSTSTDLLRLGNCMINGTLIKPAIINELTTSQKLNDGAETGYGMGWFSGQDKTNRKFFGHSGGAIGGTSNLVIYPQQKLVIVILTNISGVTIGPLTHQIASVLLAN